MATEAEEKKKTIMVEGVEVTPIKTVLQLDLVNKDRVTQITQIYFEHRGEESVVAEGRTAWTTETFDLEPLIRKRLRPKTEWQPLKFGELEPADVGVVVIQNRAGFDEGPVQLEKEQKDQLLRQLILIRKRENDSMVIVVRSGVALPIMLKDYSDLEYSCTEDADCPASIWAFPR